MAILAACGARGAKDSQSGAALRGAGLPQNTSSPAETSGRLRGLGFSIPERELSSPEFELEDLAGKKAALSFWRGKLVLLNFWATWCPPCRAEMPSLELLYRDLKNEGFELVAVDLQEDRKEVQGFQAELGLSFPILLDRDGRVGSRYGVRNIPTSYLLDREGLILGRLIGGSEWHDAEVVKVLRAILKR